jgi:hypothetical protein
VGAWQRRQRRLCTGDGRRPGFQSLAGTAGDTPEWFGNLPAKRQATLRPGISAQREDEMLKAWSQG